MYYVRYPLSYRQVEDILFERGIDITYETVRYWVDRFGPIIAREIKQKRRRNFSNWRWHLDEVFVKINGETHYLWRAIDHEGEVLECLVTKKRDRAAALKFLRKTIRQYGEPDEIVTNKLRSYGAALRQLGLSSKQVTGKHLNNLVENSHLPFRRRERAMIRFRRHKTLQKFTSIHASIYNHFNCQRTINRRDYFKKLRSKANLEWQQILAA